MLSTHFSTAPLELAHTHTQSIIQGFWQPWSEQRMGADVWVQNFAADARVTPPTDGSLEIGNKELKRLWNREHQQCQGAACEKENGELARKQSC